jgi:hypothetical protein
MHFICANDHDLPVVSAHPEKWWHSGLERRLFQNKFVTPEETRDYRMA